ncbi:MAG TPA: recombinase family protein [Vicinamibacteria bacterium]|nr:recombinase family protein [Vicinamibacteria bacterium]
MIARRTSRPTAPRATVNRFARNSHDHLAIRAHLGSLGIKLLSVTEPLEENASGRLLETMLAAFSQFDNDLRSERSVAGLKAALRRGRWTFRPPLGYRVKDGKLVPDAHRAPIICKLFELAAEGMGPTRLTREARSLGLSGVGGHALTDSAVERMLAQPAYAGLVEVAWASRVPVVNGSRSSPKTRTTGRALR